MRKITGLVVAIVGTFFSIGCLAQQVFNTCSAAFLNNKMVVDQYTTTGQCRLATTASGELTLQTVSLSPTESKGIEKLPFRVAIRDKATKTLVLVTKEEITQIEVQTVLAKCRKGDSIVLLTLEHQYALPHNEIVVQ